MPPAAAPLIGLGSSIVGGLLGRPKTQTTTQTSRSTPIYGAGQENVNELVGKFLRKGIKRGGEVQPWARSQAREQINSVYDQVLNRLETDAARRGFGGSGVEGRELIQNQYNRAGAMRQSEMDLLRDAQQRLMDYLTMGSQFGRPVGQETISTGVAPGQSAGQALGPIIGGAGQDLATMMLLRRLTSPGGAVSPPSIGSGGIPFMPGGGYSIPTPGGIGGFGY